MNEMGKAMMGTGEATGEDRAVQAAEKAIANPLLDEISLKGAKGVLINVTAGPDLTLFELDEAANRIRAEVDPDANIMVGSTLDPEMTGMMRVSVVATGIDAVARSEAMPLPSRRGVEPVAQHAVPAAPAPAAPPMRPAAAAPVEQPSYRHPPIEEAEEPFAEPLAAEVPQPVAPPAQGAQRGQPSPEALARLSRAVHNVPRAEAPATTAGYPQSSRPEPERAGLRTINSLIHRMTGSAARAEAEPARPRLAEPAPVAQRPARRVEPDFEDTERERVDIPAFLRRQAN
jgi:cell division protein FtsZ